jgi:hypothetical protein
MHVLWLSLVALIAISLVQVVINIPLGLINLGGQLLPNLGWLLVLGLLAWFLGD